MSRAVEAAAAAVAGASLGGLAGSLLGAALPLAAVGGFNGAVSGWRGIYDWRAPAGVAAFALDSTWALGTTAAALFAHGAAYVRGRPGYSAELSRRRNRHVYRHGFQPRRRFAVTLGNVVSGAGDVANPRRARLVTDHEDVHVWQARWFGPAFPVLYAGWAAGGSLVGAALWAVRRGRGSLERDSLGRVVETCAYYLNPFEWWAYSRDAHWPPAGAVPALAWKRPAVRPFSTPDVTIT